MVLAVVILVGIIAFGPRFANVNNFLNIIEASSFLALVAIGMTFVIIGGGIDLSGGSMLALAAVLAAFAAQSGAGRARWPCRCSSVVRSDSPTGSSSRGRDAHPSS